MSVFNKYVEAANRDKQHSKDQILDSEGKLEPRGVGRPSKPGQKRICFYCSEDSDRQFRIFAKKYFGGSLSVLSERAIRYYIKKFEETEHPFFT